jgi:hypothetical protein
MQAEHLFNHSKIQVNHSTKNGHSIYSDPNYLSTQHQVQLTIFWLLQYNYHHSYSAPNSFGGHRLTLQK